MKFRKDINGLRAIAVIAVVLFHFNPSWVPGGFAGVDVFFVISGFLMTGIIFRGLENNNFSVINFYVARANRIIPALSVVCLALLVFGWFYLTPLDYRALGKHVASSMGFLSNIIYWRESGYFDAASHSKWLLHTWSLSVEWQFYMIYPVVLLLLKKCMSLNNIKRLLVVTTVISFIFSAYATYKMPNASYFLLPTRAWEMMMGGLAFLYPLQNIKDSIKKYLEWLGIALILVSYTFISKDNLWPGYLALIPVLGTYLVIIANRNDSVITDNIVMQKIGLWSYSIYLWHWPIVVFGYYFYMTNWEWVGIPLSVALGFCSYKYIENIKFPVLSDISFKPILMVKSLWMAVMVGLTSSFVFIEHGFADRVDVRVISALNYKYDVNNYGCISGWAEPYNKGSCIIGNKSNIKAIVVGDSHANALLPSITKNINLDEDGIVVYSRAACPFILDVKSDNYGVYNCSNSNKFNLNEIKDRYKGIPVFVINRMSVYLYGQSEIIKRTKEPIVYFNKKHVEGNNELLNDFLFFYKKTICELSSTNRVYITTPIPEMYYNVPNKLAKNIISGRTDVDVELDVKDYLSRNKSSLKIINETSELCGSKILDVSKYLCNKDVCIGSFSGKSVYSDADHLSITGNGLLLPMFKPIFRKKEERN
ncbi:acyltransferase family protein [Shewanella marina]|uniref:acyltransferase family protein n=1 Tax=Shewanella marina TaxID=487319 RepID=UPI00046FFA43|nr:acyltransferase family protein [Shewanella marina]